MPNEEIVRIIRIDVGDLSVNHCWSMGGAFLDNEPKCDISSSFVQKDGFDVGRNLEVFPAFARWSLW